MGLSIRINPSRDGFYVSNIPQIQLIDFRSSAVANDLHYGNYTIIGNYCVVIFI